MIEQAIVFVIVAAAATYAAWKLMPRSLRTRLAEAVVRLAQQRGGLSHERAATLQRRLAAGGCGPCDGCGGCGPRTPAAAQTDVAPVHFADATSLRRPAR
jgi:type II secretory pathway pseudopilin PulG